MYSKIKLFGHPVHPMLVGFPVTLYTAALVGYLLFARDSDPFWFRVGLTANVAGVGMALITAVPGFLDWLTGIPADHPAKRTGAMHMLLNVTALAVFAVNAWLHVGYWNAPSPANATLPLALAAAGMLITLGAGWLGWNLVQKHHVGVELSPEQAAEEVDELRRAA
jgi:uncharacterized membrane protein